MPAATARSSTACEVASSEPALCMNDFSSASPNVIAPRHRLDTFTPEDPRCSYTTASSPRDPSTGGRRATGSVGGGCYLGAPTPTATGLIHDEVCTGGGMRCAAAPGVPQRSRAVSSDRPTAMYPTQEAADLAALSVVVREDPTLPDDLTPEDEPTVLRMPLELLLRREDHDRRDREAAEPVADDGRDRHPKPPNRGTPTVKLPIASLPADLAHQAALARGSTRGPGPARGRIGKYELRER